MSPWNTGHVLKLTSLPPSSPLKFQLEHFTKDPEKFINLIDFPPEQANSDRNQKVLKVLSDVTHLSNQCVSLVNLHTMIQQSRQNLSEQQTQYALYRLRLGADHIDNGECFSSLDPRAENVKKKNDKKGTIVNGYSVDDITKSGSMRERKYWPNVLGEENLSVKEEKRRKRHWGKSKRLVRMHVEFFCARVHEFVWEATKECDEFRIIKDPLGNLIPTLPFLSVNDWHKVVTQMYRQPPPSAQHAQKLLKIQNTTNYSIGYDSASFVANVGGNWGNSLNRKGNSLKNRNASVRTTFPTAAAAAVKPKPLKTTFPAAAAAAAKPKPVKTTFPQTEAAVQSKPPPKNSSVTVAPKDPSTSVTISTSKPITYMPVQQSKKTAPISYFRTESLTEDTEKQIEMKKSSNSEMIKTFTENKSAFLHNHFERWCMKEEVKVFIESSSCDLLCEVSFDKVLTFLHEYYPNVGKNFLYNKEMQHRYQQFARSFQLLVPVWSSFRCSNLFNNRLSLCPCSRFCKGMFYEESLFGKKFACASAFRLFDPEELIMHCQKEHDKLDNGAFVAVLHAMFHLSGKILSYSCRSLFPLTTYTVFFQHRSEAL